MGHFSVEISALPGSTLSGNQQAVMYFNEIFDFCALIVFLSHKVGWRRHNEIDAFIANRLDKSKCVFVPYLEITHVFALRSTILMGDGYGFM